MRVLPILLAGLLLLVPPREAGAQQAALPAGAPPQIMQDVKSGDWTDALALAQATGDPLLVKLVTFFQLLCPGGGTADEIQNFINSSPDWPEQGLLRLREAQAAGTYTPSLGPPADPFLAQVQTLHAEGNDTDAVAAWRSQAKAAAEAAAADARPLYWPAQDQLARALLSEGDAKDAYQVVIAVDPPSQGASGQLADRDFLAGFLLLRFLKDPSDAATWFTNLAAASSAVITQARAYYWRARTESGLAAQADYEHAALYPDTYYGQLAALALGDNPGALAARIVNMPEPGFSAQDALDFAVMELPRAAALLTQMQDPDDAQIFLNRLGQVAADDRNRALAAKLALGLGYPQSAVAVARSAGIAGQMLIREGWPMPVDPPAGLEPAIAYGIMRQESSFDASAVSGAGAVGLMQLMPETARRTAAKNGIPYYRNLTDPQTNMALGSAYFNGLLQSFGNCLPLAIAAYNAGPSNVATWLTENGDPEMGASVGGADLVDWVEEIPFSETRNYVQRVTESIVIYRALQTGQATSPLAPWLQS